MQEAIMSENISEETSYSRYKLQQRRRISLASRPKICNKTHCNLSTGLGSL